MQLQREIDLLQPRYGRVRKLFFLIFKKFLENCFNFFNLYHPLYTPTVSGKRFENETSSLFLSLVIYSKLYQIYSKRLLTTFEQNETNDSIYKNISY